MEGLAKVRQRGGHMPHRIAVFRRGGAMFSNLWSVTGFLALAEAEGWHPLIDFQSEKPMNYWESSATRNGWTDYFVQVSELDLNDVLASGKFEIFSERPGVFPISEYSQDPRYREFFVTRIHLNEEMAAYVSEWLKMLAASGTVLGVHFRGTDMKVAKSHWAPPTQFQMLNTIDRALETGDFAHIFVATEDDGNLQAIRKRFGKMVFTSDSFRTRETRKLSRMESPVLQWRYLLGKQVIRDTWLLGHCDGLVSGHSNVSEHAQVLAGGRYRVNFQIRRPRVDVVGSQAWMIRATNFAREYSTSRFLGPDFRVLER